jgi:hydrogenase maturation protease
MEQPARKVVLGLGNMLGRDEGLGLAALELLADRLDVEPGVAERPGTLELLDGGVLGLDLLPLVEDCTHLLVLDAANVGQPAGSVVELSRDQIPLYTGLKMSEHQVTFQEVLALANLRGHLPGHLHLIGVQPEEIALGLDLTPTVRAALPAVVERAVAVLGEWGLT